MSSQYWGVDVKRKIQICSLICMVILWGAIASACQPAVQPNDVVSMIVSNTITLSPTPSPTGTVTPISTQTPAKEKTITKMPTLSALEAEEKVIDLLKVNGGCALPCFWGFSPNQTNKQTIVSFFESFVEIGHWRISLSRRKSDIRISQYWVEDENDQIRYVTVNLGSYKTVDFGDGPYYEYIFDNPVFYEYTKYYSLSNILSVYGQPEQVYVYVDPGRDMGFEDLYHIQLNYSKSGFIVHYSMKLITETDCFVGCPEESFIYLKLWTPGDESVESEENSIIDYSDYHPLEEMTSLTIDEFFEIYKNPDSQNCLRTKEDFYKQYRK